MTGELAVMGREGDTKILWNKNSPDEVEVARASFEKLRGKGYAAFAVKKNGDQGEQIFAFDPNAERIIMAPQMVGG